MTYLSMTPHSRDDDDIKGNKLLQPYIPTPKYLKTKVKDVDRWFTFKKRSLHYRSVGAEIQDDGDVCYTIYNSISDAYD